MKHDPKRLQVVLESAAPRAGMLTFKPMFGGIMVYADGKPFASLSHMGIALKLDPDGRAELLAVAGAEPLRYEPDSPPSKSYVTVPDAMHGDIAALATWVARSVEAVGRIPVKGKRNGPKRRGAA